MLSSRLGIAMAFPCIQHGRLAKLRDSGNVRTYRTALATTVEPTVTLTELRQRLFQLADQVIESGEPLVIERRGVRLRLVREDAAATKGGRLARLKLRKQSVVVGPALDPHESPAAWGGAALSKVAEPNASGWPVVAKPGRRRKP